MRQSGSAKDESSGADVIGLILLDHKYLKQCLGTLTSDEATKKEKLSAAKGFLDAFEQHSFTERKTVYKPLVDHPEVHFNILEAQAEHDLIDGKVRSLKPRIARARTLKDELHAELKVLAELVRHHIQEEESELLPRLRTEIDEETLRSLGAQFLKVRNLPQEKHEVYPDLEEELIQWKDSVQKLSSQFLSKMDEYMENLKH